MLMVGVVYGAIRQNVLQCLEDKKRTYCQPMQKQREDSIQPLTKYVEEVNWTTDRKDD